MTIYPFLTFASRYMMMICRPLEIYLFDRDFSVFVAPDLKFPRRKNLDEHITDTLVDGVGILPLFVLSIFIVLVFLFLF